MKHFTEEWFTVDPLTKEYLIEIKVDTFKRLFNRLDPSPFSKRDLNPKVADYITEGVSQIPKNRKFSINFHLPAGEKDMITENEIQKCAYFFFSYSYKLAASRLKYMLFNIILGFCIAIPILVLASYLTLLFEWGKSWWQLTILNGTTVAGWVALWAPVSNLLFGIFERVKEMRFYRRIINSDILFHYYQKD